MNVALYFLSLALILPVMGVAVLCLLLDAVISDGLWAMVKTIFSMIDSPVKLLLWLACFLLAAAGLAGAGFISEARNYGFGAIAILGVAACLVVVRVVPGPFDWGLLLFFSPAAAGVALSVYCMLKPAR